MPYVTSISPVVYSLCSYYLNFNYIIAKHWLHKPLTQPSPSPYNIQVLNFYELREMVHVRTVPLMEELEAVVLLNSDHSNCLLLNHKGQSREGSAVSGDWTRHVVISAGECGLLHVAVVSIRVRYTWEGKVWSLCHQTLHRCMLSDPVPPRVPTLASDEGVTSAGPVGVPSHPHPCDMNDFL